MIFGALPFPRPRVLIRNPWQTKPLFNRSFRPPNSISRIVPYWGGSMLAVIFYLIAQSQRLIIARPIVAVKNTSEGRKRSSRSRSNDSRSNRAALFANIASSLLRSCSQRSPQRAEVTTRPRTRYDSRKGRRAWSIGRWSTRIPWPGSFESWRPRWQGWSPYYWKRYVRKWIQLCTKSGTSLTGYSGGKVKRKVGIHSWHLFCYSSLWKMIIGGYRLWY